VKDTHAAYERIYHESVTALNKAQRQFYTAQDELERFVVAKEGESMKDARMQSPQQGASGSRKGQSPIVKAIGKGGMLLNRKNPAALARQEDDVRAKMSSASNGYHKSKLDMEGLRSEYFNLQLPRTLRVRRYDPGGPSAYEFLQALKELSDEIDTAMQFHLSKYAYLLESSLLSDAVTLVPKGPEDGPGLKAIMESIDNRTDFKEYVQAYRIAHQGMGRGPHREDPIEMGFVRNTSILSTQ